MATPCALDQRLTAHSGFDMFKCCVVSGVRTKFVTLMFPDVGLALQGREPIQVKQ